MSVRDNLSPHATWPRGVGGTAADGLDGMAGDRANADRPPQNVLTLSHTSTGQDTALLKLASAIPSDTPSPKRRGWKKMLAYGLAGVTFCALLLTTIVLWAIGSSVGPAHPERDGRAYLQERRYSNELIERVIAREPLDAATFDQLAGEDSIDVKFLIAQNPALPAPLLDRLSQDASDFVRGGAAQNPHLTAAQIRALSADKSVTTQSYLAGNPHVPEADLIRLHEEHDVPLLWFAMNPQCPAVLKQKMIDTQDEEALAWLKEQTEGSSDGSNDSEPPGAPTQIKPVGTTDGGV